MTFARLSTCFLVLLIFTFNVPLIASSNPIGDADRHLFRYINEDMENRFLDVSLPVIQRMGDTPIYLGICTLLCAFGNEHMDETGTLAAAAAMEAAVVAYALKFSVRRSRPLEPSNLESFPSGHVTLAFAMATVVGHEYPKLRIPLYLTALGTAFARIYLGRHYPSDVLGGAIIGTLAGISVLHWRDRIIGFSF